MSETRGHHGRHAGPRRAPAAPTPWLAILLHALGITACVVAWGYLVWAAIDFGVAVRDGDTAAWWALALATLGAVTGLFAALLLGVRLVRLLAPARETSAADAPPRPVGGRRAAR